ncbi:MAG: hypothetical protein WDZ52_11990, partial [Pseudohongiellaceae bacterium]
SGSIKTPNSVSSEPAAAQESVQEIGDFIAHRDERSKGLITRTTRDWFAIIRFTHPWDRPLLLDSQAIPPLFTYYLRATLHRLSATLLKEKTGFTHATADRILRRISKKLGKNPDGTLRIVSSFAKDEDYLIGCLCSGIIVKGAFTEDRLYTDFVATLKSNGLLAKTEMHDFGRCRATISLFAASVMHNCDIYLDDSSITKLRVTPDSIKDNVIGVIASVPFSARGGVAFVSSAIFDTELYAQDYCTPELLSIARPWDFDLEVTSNGILSPIV